MRKSMMMSALLLLVAPAMVAGQGLAGVPAGRSAVSLDILHPTFDDDDNLSITSGAYLLGAAFVLRPNVSVFAELPLARTSQRAFGETRTSASIGNPYLGGVLDRGSVRFEAGLRLPLAKDNEEAVFYGAFTDINRAEAFIPDVATARVTAAFTTVAGPGSLVIALGPTALIPTGSDEFEDDETELLLDYAGTFTYPMNRARLSAGLHGRAIATEEGSLAERTQHVALVAASYAFGPIRPGIQVRMPLDKDLREITNGTFGVFVQVDLGR